MDSPGLGTDCMVRLVQQRNVGRSKAEIIPWGTGSGVGEGEVARLGGPTCGCENVSCVNGGCARNLNHHQHLAQGAQPRSVLTACCTQHSNNSTPTRPVLCKSWPLCGGCARVVPGLWQQGQGGQQM